jgi:carbon monoxide dehydrogenase subunit G
MVKLEISTVINRPVEEVFAFLSIPENDPKWISSSNDVKKTSEGPIGVGATFRTVVRFLGRRIEGESEFTEYEPKRRYATKSKSGPFPVENQSTFERVDGGTRITFTTVAETGGFFKLAEPLLVSMVKRQFEADFANLKDLMETHALRAREATRKRCSFGFVGHPPVPIF